MLIQNKHHFFGSKSFLSIIMLCILIFQGCSSNIDNTKLIKNPADMQIESIGAPKLVLEKTLYDFGEIKPNSKKTAIFSFTNLGDRPLIIKDVKKCCGTVAKVDKKGLAPGESGRLTVEYHTGQGSGIFKRQVGLITNDPNSPHTPLTFTGKVVQTLMWFPADIEISSFKQEDTLPEITIKSLNNEPFTIKGFNATAQCLTAEFEPVTKATEFTLKPELDTAKLEALPSNKGIITIDLDHPDYDKINLKFNVIPALQAIPAQILVFNAKINESVRKPLTLQNNAEPDRYISELLESVTSQNGSKVDVLEFTELDTGCKLDLEIWPSSSNEGSELFSQDQLVFKMKDGRELDVPVRIFYKTQKLSSKAD